MKLYHGTRVLSLQAKEMVCDFPMATKATNGVGFYVTDNINIARSYGNVIEWEVGSDWVCGLMRPITVGPYTGVEYVLSQAEADALVVDHAISTTIH